MIVRGDGCYLEDTTGQSLPRRARRPLLREHRLRLRREIGEAALEQMPSCPSTRPGRTRTRGPSSSPRSWPSLAPGDLNRSSSSPAAPRRSSRPGSSRGSTTSARDGEAPLQGDRAAARLPRDDDGRAVAERRPGDPRSPFEPLVPEVRHVHNTNRYHRPAEETEEEFTAFLLDELEHSIQAMGPETVCLVHMEPVQSTGGCLTPPAGYFQGVREICDRYDILLCGRRGDHRLRPPRALVRLGALRHPARPRHVREGPVVVVRVDRRRDRDRPRLRAVPRRAHDVLARDHFRRPPGACARSRSRTSRS